MKPLHAFLARCAIAPDEATASTARSAPLGANLGRGGSPTAVDIATTIEQALTAAGLLPRADHGEAIDSPLHAAAGRPAPFKPAAQAIVSGTSPVARRQSPRTPASTDRADAGARGVSFQRNFKNAAGARAYTLYVPAGHDPCVPAPMVLMLHGCTQNPADFATGTRMNALADQYGVLVAYPAQTPRDNGNRCWNWFRRQDQLRGEGEPSILAGIVADIAADHRVDPQRVYAAGLSAGAAMAVILGETYPDVFAAVGAHSGLPFGVAHDVPGAFAAMQGTSTAARANAGATPVAGTGRRGTMPTIVFHGDADRTVNCSNGLAIAEGIVGASRPGAPLIVERTQAKAGGRSHTRVTYAEASGPALVEHWTIHGAGHAWSGGDPAGSHVDATGPDASAEMLRFFLQHTNAGNA